MIAITALALVAATLASAAATGCLLRVRGLEEQVESLDFHLTQVRRELAAVRRRRPYTVAQIGEADLARHN